MHEKEIVQEMITLMGQHIHACSTDRAPKVTLKIPKSFQVDASLLACLFEEARRETTFPSATICMDICKSQVYCQDCGRQYRGPFLFDICQRCRGSHFELDDHLQVAVEAWDRRAPHKLHKEVWRVGIPAT